MQFFASSDKFFVFKTGYIFLFLNIFHNFELHPGHFDHYDAENLGSVIFFLRVLIFSVLLQQIISLKINSGTELLLPSYGSHQNLHQFFDLELGLSQPHVCLVQESAINLAKFIHGILSFLSLTLSFLTFHLQIPAAVFALNSVFWFFKRKRLIFCCSFSLTGRCNSGVVSS